MFFNENGLNLKLGSFNFLSMKFKTLEEVLIEDMISKLKTSLLNSILVLDKST